MNITNFALLLRAAAAQAVPQRLLFVFATAELPDDATPAQRADFEAGHGGALAPHLCVDKSVTELSTFEALVREVEAFGKAWHIVFVAALSEPPAGGAVAQSIETALHAMVASIQAGDIGRYLAFDRAGDSVTLA